MDSEDQDVGLMMALEDAEKNTQHIATSEWCLPMITCEEPVDLSYLEGSRAFEIQETIACTNVGGVRVHLDVQLGRCLIAELCEFEPSEDYSAGDAPGGIPKEEIGASIFDHGSRM